MPTAPGANAPSTKNKRHFLSYVLAAAIVAIAVFISLKLFDGREQPEAKQAEEMQWNVRAQALQPQPYQPVISLYGRVESARDATLSAAITADVQSVNVLAGNSVEAGELLVSLDDRETTLALAQAQADYRLLTQQGETDQLALKTERQLLRLSEQEYQRFQDLKQRGLSSQAQLDQSRQGLQRQQLAVSQRELAVAQFTARKAQAQARLDRAKLDQSRSRITAPFSGEVTRVQIAQGDRVATGQALISLYDPKLLEVKATIPNRYLNRIRQAQRQQQHINAILNLDGQALPMRLARLAAASDAGSGSTDAYFQPITAAEAAPPQSLAPGRNAALQLRLPAVPNTAVVPYEAIYGLNSVYRIVDQRLEALRIERLGDYHPAPNSSQPRAVIQAEGLQAGDLILATQLAVAVNGLKVAVVDTLAAAD